MKIPDYIKNLPKGYDAPIYKGLKLKSSIDRFLKLVGKGNVIIEFGSGTGRDADYMESKGYKVVRTDSEKEFIGFQAEKGKKVLKLNLKNGNTLSFKDMNAAFVSCVFGLFSWSDIQKSFNTIFQILRHNAFFYFNVPCEWAESDIIIICKSGGFKINKIIKDAVWYHVICQRKLLFIKHKA
jgi:SAM-dependent methyltransferase